MARKKNFRAKFTLQTCHLNSFCYMKKGSEKRTHEVKLRPALCRPLSEELYELGALDWLLLQGPFEQLLGSVAPNSPATRAKKRDAQHKSLRHKGHAPTNTLAWLPLQSLAAKKKNFFFGANFGRFRSFPWYFRKDQGKKGQGRVGVATPAERRGENKFDFSCRFWAVNNL